MDNRTQDELVAPVVQQGSAPALKRSVNTRLGVTPGGVAHVPAFTTLRSFSTGTRVTAIVQSAAGKRALISATPELGVRNEVIADAGRTALGYPNILTDEGGNSYLQQSFMPAQVVDSEGVAQGKASSQIALSYNAVSLTLWHAYVSPAVPSDRVMVYAATPSGVALSAPQEVVTLTAPARAWVGLTSHGANGDRVWYVNNSGAVCYRTISASNNTISVGSEVGVVTPGSSTTGLDLCSADATTAYLAHSRVGTPADGTLRAVNVLTGATSASVNITNALLGGGQVAVFSGTLNGVARVVVGFSAVTGLAAVARVYDAALTTLAATTPAQSSVGRITVSFYQEDTYFGPVLVTETSSSSLLVSASAYDFAGSFLDTLSAPWCAIAGHATTWNIDATHQYPIVQFVPRFGTTLEQPGEANFVEDPSLELGWLSAPFGACASIFARIGVVRGTTSPADVYWPGTFASKGLLSIGNDLHVAYRTLSDYGGTATGTARAGRRTVVRLGSGNKIPSAQDRDGLGLMGGALPFQWDGRRVVELGAPLHAPQLTMQVGGGAPVMPAGVYSFRAVLYWQDGAGLVHRSRPSPVRTATLNGTTDTISAAISQRYSIHTRLLEARLYSTVANGTTFHLMSSSPFQGSLVTFSLNAEVITTARAQLYSGGGIGEELVPQPPPPAWDISVIGQRCWIVDAEIRSRVVYSKLRIAGVGFEFAPALEILMPSGAGKVMAVREWQGTAVVLCERAVFQVPGDGPNNTLGGPGAYGAPLKLSDLGCSNVGSIAVFPGGIVWQCGQRFVALNGSGVANVKDFLCLHDVSAVVVLAKYAEVLFFSDTQAEIRVFNYESASWSVWDSLALPYTVTIAGVLPHDPDTALVYSEAAGKVFRLDVASQSPAPLLFETDWLLLGGDFQDPILLRDVVFNGRIGGPHTIRLQLYLDYEASPSTDITYTDVELAAIATNGNYSVRFEPCAGNCRAVKLLLSETASSGLGCVPRSVTIVWARDDGMLREDAFPQGSRK